MPIRPTRFEDLDQVAEVLVRAWQFAYVDVVPADLMERFCDVPMRAERMRNGWNPDFFYLVSMDDTGRIVGMAREGRPPGVDGFDCEIGALYVRPEHARFGHGRALVAAMAGAFWERGARSLCIHTLRANRIGRSFYEKLGGELVHEDAWEGLPAVWYGWRDLAGLVNP